jgi:hypothetical protein
VFDLAVGFASVVAVDIAVVDFDLEDTFEADLGLAALEVVVAADLPPPDSFAAADRDTTDFVVAVDVGHLAAMAVSVDRDPQLEAGLAADDPARW